LTDEAERWRQWLRRHGAALLLFARQWCATSAEAEDAVQDGFARFWSKRGRPRDQTAYLYACVRAAAMDLGRGRRRRETRERNSARGEMLVFEQPLEKVERQARIEAVLAQLPGDQREVVVMKIWGELTFAQIGAALGVSLNTAASRYRLALARMAAELAEEVAHD